MCVRNLTALKKKPVRHVIISAEVYFYVHFNTNTFRIGMNLSFRPPAMGLIAEKTGLLKIGRDLYTDNELIKNTHPLSARITQGLSQFIKMNKN